MGIASGHIALIATVGESPGQPGVVVCDVGRVGFYAQRAAKENSYGHAHDAFGQTETERTAFAQLALGGDTANVENPAHLAIFVDDALAVHQAETVRALRVRS